MNRLDTLVHFVDDGTVNGQYDVGSDTLIASFDYTVREDGKRTAVTETFDSGLMNTVSWEYDNLGRLTSEDFDSSDNNLDFYHEYEFDLTGNRQEWRKYDAPQGTLLETVSYDYDANDRLLEETSSTGVITTYGWTLTQQTSKTVTQTDDSSVLTTFAYDLQGRMSVVVVENRNTSGTPTSRDRSTFEYDAHGFRIYEKNETDATADGTYETFTTTEYLADGRNHTGYTQTIRETHRDSSGTIAKTVDYSFGHDEISQNVVEYDSQGQVTSAIVHFFGHDGHGSVRVLIDDQGGIAEIYHYDAYGNPIGFQPGVALTSILHNGEAFNARINLQYLRARWYDAVNGRFPTKDEFIGNHSDPQSFHKYLYTHADPVNGIDPTGRSLISIAIANSWGFIKRTFAAGASYLAYASIQTKLFLATVGSQFLIRMNQLGGWIQQQAAFAGAYWRTLVDSGWRDRLFQFATTTDYWWQTWWPRIETALDVMDITMSFLDGASKMLSEYDQELPTGNETRGRLIEDVAGANLRGNVKGIDHVVYNESGRAGVISIRSHDVQDANSLRTSIRTDLRELYGSSRELMDGYDGDGNYQAVRPENVDVRGLLVVVPDSARTWFKDMDQELQWEAKNNGFVIRIVSIAKWIRKR